jgi:biotin carboxylase
VKYPVPDRRLAARGKTLVFIGAGSQAVYREYALIAMASRANLVLIDKRQPPWIEPYVGAFYPLEQPGLDHMLEVARAAIKAEAADGIVTYDDRYTVPVAQLAEEAGLAGSGLASAIACKDKRETRARLNSLGLGSVGFRLANSADEAMAAVDELGLPVVMKPRSLSASKGVIKVDSIADVSAGYLTAATASVSGPVFSAPGVLIEEYVHGAEFIVDSVIHQGQVQPLFVTTKTLGPPPYFEEVAHVSTAGNFDLLPGVRLYMQAVHEALGFADGVSHTELRVSDQGYRIMEVNSRLGGGMLPYIGFLATGMDLAAAVADIGLGTPPVIQQTRDRAAAITFIFPEHDMTLGSLDVPDEVLADPRVDRVVPLAKPGDVLMLPPAGYASRIAMVITVGDDVPSCQQAMTDALAKITITPAS